MKTYRTRWSWSGIALAGLICGCNSSQGGISAGGSSGSAVGVGGVNGTGQSGAGITGAPTGGRGGSAGHAAAGRNTALGGASIAGTKGSAGTATNKGGSGAAGNSGAGGRGGAGGSAGSSSGGKCTPPASGLKGANPLFTDQYTADPGALVHNCTFYIQCGHDEGQTGFVMKEWFLLSSTDMVHWTKKVALKLSDFKWADANAWAGQMVAKDGKFYWYVPVNQAGSGMAIAVAVADSPEGPFKDALGKALVDDAFEMANMGFRTPSDTVYTIDPTVFVDTDGQAYLQYGGFGRMVVAKLNSEMISINGKMQIVTPRDFFEAPFLIKRNNKYYEIYAAGVNPASLDYSTASSPLGPWTYGGRILDPLPNVAGQDAATSHPSVAEFAGQWYLVYHVSNGPNGGGTYRREVAIDKLTFNTDGSIQKVVPSPGLTF